MVRFLDPEIVKMDDSFSGSRNRKNGAISGSRNQQNGRQILYGRGSGCDGGRGSDSDGGRGSDLDGRMIQIQIKH